MKNKLTLLLLFCAGACGALNTDLRKFFDSGSIITKRTQFPFALYSNGKIDVLKNRTFFCMDKKLNRRCLVSIGKQNKPVALLGESGHARYNVYSALLAGARGIFIKAPKLDKKYSDIRGELNGKMKLGQLFLFGKTRNDLKIKIIAGPKKIRCTGKEYPSVAMANIAYKNSRYVFLVNSGSETVELIVDGLVYGSTVTVQDIFVPEDVFTAPEGDFELEIKPLEVKAFRIYNKINH
jgi:hypothetical protein